MVGENGICYGKKRSDEIHLVKCNYVKVFPSIPSLICHHRRRLDFLFSVSSFPGIDKMFSISVARPSRDFACFMLFECKDILLCFAFRITDRKKGKKIHPTSGESFKAKARKFDVEIFRWFCKFTQKAVRNLLQESFLIAVRCLASFTDEITIAEAQKASSITSFTLASVGNVGAERANTQSGKERCSFGW